MIYLFILVVSLFYISCSNQEQEGIPAQNEMTPQTSPAPTSVKTMYGDSGLIQKYLTQINPYIQEVGKIQLEIDKVVGSSQKATGPNLAMAMKKNKPRLETALAEFSAISPPPLLSAFHEDIKKLMSLRLEAYNSTIAIASIDDKSDDESLYQDAESKLKEANALITHLNGEMTKINQALSTVPSQVQTATP